MSTPAAADDTSRLRGDGLLAIWNDCAPDWLEAYEDWYQSEHLPERLSIPGFLRGRRYQALTPGPEFLTTYDVTAPKVLHSPAYRARLDAPTPKTSQMMRHAFRNVSRTVCRRTTHQDGPVGACCVTFITDDVETAQVLANHLDDTTVRRVDLWIAEDDRAAPSAEETLRGGDARIRAGLFVEISRAEAARRLAHAVGGQAFQLVTEMIAHRKDAEL